MRGGEGGGADADDDANGEGVGGEDGMRVGEDRRMGIENGVKQGAVERGGLGSPATRRHSHRNAQSQNQR